jgi:hypothetical protein
MSKESEYRNPGKKKHYKRKTSFGKAKSLRRGGPLDDLHSAHDKHKGRGEDPGRKKKPG